MNRWMSPPGSLFGVSQQGQEMAVIRMEKAPAAPLF